MTDISNIDFARIIDADPEFYNESLKRFKLPERFLGDFEEEFEKSKDEASPDGNLKAAFGRVLYKTLSDEGLLDFFEGILDHKVNGAIRELIDAVVERHPNQDLTKVSPRDFLKNYVGTVGSMFLLFLRSKLKDLFELKLLMEENLRAKETVNEFSGKIKERDAKVEELTAEFSERLALAAEEIAAIDALTGLESRARYERKLQTIESDPRPKEYWILFLDLDNFKSVNDQYGHATGDTTLAEFAKIIQRHTREGSAYRYGGEEFVLIIDAERMSKKAVEAMAQALRKGVESKIFYTSDEGAPFKRTISVGVALGKGADIRKTVKKADDSAYKVKESGKNNIWFNEDEAPVVKRNGSGKKSLPPTPSPLKS